MGEYRSVSQVKAYEECPYRYKLERIDKAWQRPAAWFPMGTAVHEAIEAYERSGRTMPLAEAEEVYAESYAKEVGKYCEQTPNFEYWSWSGRYNGEADIERRFGIGKAQVAGYYEYVAEHPDDVIWIAPDGTPGLELGFDVDFDGVPVRGFIDQVKPGKVTDIKTGLKPGDTFQLKVYAMALEKLYGETWSEGEYWMGKTGKPTKPYDLTAVSDEEVYARFHAADDGITAGEFPAKPGAQCNRCSVNTACPFAVFSS